MKFHVIPTWRLAILYSGYEINDSTYVENQTSVSKPVFFYPISGGIIRNGGGGSIVRLFARKFGR